jgi:predicted transposase YbfD/YdcC
MTETLWEAMRELEDKALHNGYWYSIGEALTIMVCGMLCCLESIDDIHEWSKAEPTQKFFHDQFGIEKVPCRAQFYNILACVDAEKFSIRFAQWMQKVTQGDRQGKTVAIDGKTICSTDKLAAGGNALHIASAIVSEYGFIIGSRECNTKMGEITAFRELLDLLDVAGAVVVADALHCNRKSAQAVVDAKAAYLFSVKDNNPTLKENIALYIHNETLDYCETVEKNGGRIEKRTAYASHDIDWLDGKETWADLACVGAIHTEFEKAGKKSSEWHYYISSTPLSPKELLRHARLEWRVEAMHWLLDVHFKEDKTRVWDMNLQKTLNITRKIVLNLAKAFLARSSRKIPISAILKRNLFDLHNLSAFLDSFAN